MQEKLEKNYSTDLSRPSESNNLVLYAIKPNQSMAVQLSIFEPTHEIWLHEVLC